MNKPERKSDEAIDLAKISETLGKLAHKLETLEVTKQKSTNRIMFLHKLFLPLVLFTWIALFLGGILVDTREYRMIISPAGVLALEQGDGVLTLQKHIDSLLLEENTSVAVPPADSNRNESGDANAAAKKADREKSSDKPEPSLFLSLLITFLFFLPTNLLLLSLLSGWLGSCAHKVRLEPDISERDKITGSNGDNTHTFISGILRGFFVFVLVISGMYIVENNPLSGITPNQYIRLAGFISLSSFIISYNPEYFNSFLSMANKNLAKTPAGKTQEKNDEKENRQSKAQQQKTEDKKEIEQEPI